MISSRHTSLLTSSSGNPTLCRENERASAQLGVAVPVCVCVHRDSGLLPCRRLLPSFLPSFLLSASMIVKKGDRRRKGANERTLQRFALTSSDFRELDKSEIADKSYGVVTDFPEVTTTLLGAATTRRTDATDAAAESNAPGMHTPHAPAVFSPPLSLRDRK